MRVLLLLVPASLLACVAILPRAVGRDSIDLAGIWDLAYDDEDRGLAERWFDPDSPGAARAPWGIGKVPGCFPAPGGGIRHPDGEHSIGWYRRTFEVPEEWRGRRVRIRFEAVERSARVFVNGAEVGGHVGGWAPFTVDAAGSARPGTNTLAVRVEHRERATRGFVQLVGSNYAGIWQGVALEGKDDLTLEDFFARGKVHPPFADLEVVVKNAGGSGSRFTVTGRVEGEGDRTVSLYVPARAAVPVRLPIEIKAPVLWEPGRPHLYEGSVSLERDGREVDRASARFGLREVRAEGNAVLLNGRPIEFRGVLHWGWYPDRIAPAPDGATAREEFAAMRALGFNGVKPCLVVFPEAWYRAADEEGILLWQEYPNWQIRVDDANREALVREYGEMARALRHHPSIVLSSLSTEWDKRYFDGRLVDRAFAAVKEKGPSSLLLDNSGGWGGPPPRPLGPSRLAEFQSAHPYPGRLRGFDAAGVARTREKPFLLGETIDGDTFKNLPRILERNGGAPPWWMRPFQVEAAPQMPEPLYERMEGLSKRQVLAYRKFLVEAFRARPELSGFVVTHLHDVIDLGSGLLDEARQPKWGPGEFLPFNGETAVLAEWPARAVWKGEALSVPLLVRHSGARPLEDARVEWKGPGGRGGSLGIGRIEPGSVVRAGEAVLETADAGPGEHSLEAEAVAKEGRWGNRWKVWVFDRSTLLEDAGGRVLLDDAGGSLAAVAREFRFLERLDPAAPEVPRDAALVVSRVPSGSTRAWVRAGGRLLLLGPDAVPNRRAFFRRESVTALGRHPALGRFPHEGFPDLQFLEMEPDLAVDLSGEDGLVAIAPRIDCRTPRRTDAYLVEAKVGEGGVLAAAFDVSGGGPAACSLVDALLRYAVSPLFRPIGRLTPLGERVWLDSGLYADRDGDRAMRRGSFVRSWRLAGPFDNATSGWKATYPPEGGFRPDARYPDGYGGEVGWIPHDSPSDFVDLAGAYPGADRVAVYAYAEFESDVEAEADLWVGSDDGERVWWNGELVLDRSDHREPHPDQDRARVLLRRGSNSALLRICDANHRLGFWFRIAVPDGVAPPRTTGS
ncbi:MAG: hypothetical protein L0323_15300 [Planctomycetes bacterium]|nr:hypothetical protein [Planctomycetota bacterium]